jgi:hypothetical protein
MAAAMTTISNSKAMRPCRFIGFIVCTPTLWNQGARAPVGSHAKGSFTFIYQLIAS